MRIDIRGEIVEDDLQRIYEWWGMSAVSPKKVLDALKEAAEGEEIDVYINSPGGDVSAGAEIYSELRARGATVHITGLAASAASVIACAGKRTLISPAGCMMIHNVFSGAWGDYHEMERTAEALKQVGRTISSAYREKTGMEEKELLKLMDRESWMNAEDAVRFGFCDGIEDRPAEQPEQNKKVRPAAGFGASLTAEQIERARREIAKAKSADDDRKRKAVARLRLLKTSVK